MSDGMTDFDVDVLRCCNGEEIEGMCWGVGIGVAIEFLKGKGLIEGVMEPGKLVYKPTQAGLDFLDRVAESSQR